MNYIVKNSFHPTNCDNDDLIDDNFTNDDDDDDDGDGDGDSDKNSDGNRIHVANIENFTIKTTDYPKSPYLSSFESLISFKCNSVFEQSLIHIKSPLYEDISQKIYQNEFINYIQTNNNNNKMNI
ncbi:unnamed protein product [Heterobilharzia americana]|nr:unnamed protein product [Heterobilharzia americana]